MNIMFLDIDGVLNGHEWCHMRAVPKIYYDKMMILNQIIENCNHPGIVICSTWRWMINHNHVDNLGFTQLLGSHGCIGDVVGAIRMRNELLDISSDKREGILKYFEDHQNIRKFIVLDDADLGEALAPRQIKPKHREGLIPRHITKAEEIWGD